VAYGDEKAVGGCDGVNILELQNVSKHFGGVKALQDINIEVEEQKLTALIGPNGSGKSTLFNVVTAINSPTSGEILFKKRSIERKPSHEIIRMGVARTFQNIRLFNSMSVLENVMLGAHSRSKGGFLSAALKLPAAGREQTAVARKAIDMLEYVGMEEHIYDQAINLPYGKKRLVEIARALASEPELLLLDEPAAGMNETETESLKTLILRTGREKGISILLVEHDMKLVMGIAEWIFVLDHGQRIAAGTAAEIRKNPKVIEAYLGREVIQA
jgi:branched-chain amino acid transport system ATP-binding protein